MTFGSFVGILLFYFFALLFNQYDTKHTRYRDDYKSCSFNESSTACLHNADDKRCVSLTKLNCASSSSSSSRGSRTSLFYTRAFWIRFSNRVHSASSQPCYIAFFLMKSERRTLYNFVEQDEPHRITTTQRHHNT